MTSLFEYSSFNGDISKWDTSSVTHMSFLFLNSIFNQDISNWNTINVLRMDEMFCSSLFNGDLSRWDVSNVETMYETFKNCNFKKDISCWEVSKFTDKTLLFEEDFEPYNLLTAAFIGDVVSVKKFIEEGVNLTETNSKGSMASEVTSIPEFKALVEKEALSNLIDTGSEESYSPSL